MKAEKEIRLTILTTVKLPHGEQYTTVLGKNMAEDTAKTIVKCKWNQLCEQDRNVVEYQLCKMWCIYSEAYGWTACTPEELTEEELGQADNLCSYTPIFTLGRD